MRKDGSFFGEKCEQFMNFGFTTGNKWNKIEITKTKQKYVTVYVTY